MIRMAEPVFDEAEVENVADAVRSGWWSGQGPFIQQFEDEFARFCGAQFGIATTSGTTALHLALAVLGVRAGDEVIVPTLTMIAVANSVAYTGAHPVFADAERIYWNPDPAKLESLITPRTRAIIAAHSYGHPADMDAINEVARKHDLPLVEDAAEAHGAEYHGRRAGSLGDIACFSFYSNKLISTGEGGMLVTNNSEQAAHARKLRDQAYEKERRFWHQELGFNYRMTNIQAALGVAQLKKIDRFVETRRRNAARYSQRLAGLTGLDLPAEAPGCRSVYWMYSIVVRDGFRLDRDGLSRELARAGIESRPFFYPLHLQPLYQDIRTGASLPVAEDLATRGLNLPSGNELTIEQVDFIADTIVALSQNPR
jgi:perosamine synthetase